MSHAGPTASRTAPSRATSSATCARPTLILAPPKPFAFAASASSTSACGSIWSQPPSVVYRGHDSLAPPGDDVQRQLRATATQIPQGRIDGRQRERRDRADRRSVGVKQEIAPQRLDVFGIATDEARRQMIPKQRDDGRAARADRIAVAGPDCTVAIEDPYDRRFLRHETLNGVGAFDLRFEIDELDLDAFDGGHECSSAVS